MFLFEQNVQYLRKQNQWINIGTSTERYLQMDASIYSLGLQKHQIQMKYNLRHTKTYRTFKF